MTTKVLALRNFTSSIRCVGSRTSGEEFDLSDRVLAEDLKGQGLVDIVGEVPNEEGFSQGGPLEQLVSSSPVVQVSAVTSANTSPPAKQQQKQQAKQQQQQKQQAKVKGR